jgi:hypothetical protein
MGGTVFGGKVHSKLAGSFRWFRKGMNSQFPEDAYICFWIALEMIAPEFFDKKPRYMLCPRCHEQVVTCPNCGKTTEMEAGVSDGIVNLFHNHLGWTKSKFRDLNKLRAKLMHGGTPVSESFRHRLINGNGHLRNALLKGYEVLINSGNGPRIGPHTHPLQQRLVMSPWGNQLNIKFSLPQDNDT